ncbi:MAG: MBL fold metallo-hydrolase [Clostridia bacterium]|nr:MBL fold metallo-hydrolase [Clostridia bacterium]
MKAIIKVLAIVLALAAFLTFVGCSTKKGDDDADSATTLKMKFFKAGRSTCIVMRCDDGVIMIDTAADDQSDDIIAYLAEKNIKKIDYLIITNYSKKHIGGAPAILSNPNYTIENVIVPTYKKASNPYYLFANALSTAGITATEATSNTSFTLGKINIDLYVPHKNYSSALDENDEGNSVAVAVTYEGQNLLMTSRVAGERINELIADLNGKTFNTITVPNYGIYDSNDDALFNAVKAKSAIAICSNNAEKKQMDAATISALTSVGTKVYATRDGSIEVHLSSEGTSINGTAIN